MDIACIARCIGVAVFAASLQAMAQPPEGKGKPAHAGASPFIRFPVPQQSVGVVRHSQAVAVPQAKAPELAGKAFGKSANPALVVRGNAFGKSMSPAPVVIAAPVAVPQAKAPELAGKAFGNVARANGQANVAGNAFGKSMSPAPVVIAAPVVTAAPAVTDGRTGMVDLKAPGLPEPVVLASGAGPSPAQKKAPPPECGAR